MPSPASEAFFARPRMLVCDLDGTLLNGQGTMTPGTVEALRLAVERGVEVVFATGRRHAFAARVLKSLQPSPETMLVSSNGAIGCTLGGERRWRWSMPVATALLLCRRLSACRDSLIFTFERIGCGALAAENIAALHRRIPRWVDSNVHEIACFRPLERAFDSGEEPIQAMICGTPREMEAAMRLLDDPTPMVGQLRSGLAIQRTEYAARDLSIVDLMPAGCSKGSAVAALANERGIDPAEVACIGDNMNDADMLVFAGQSVVMKNAAAELLQMAAIYGWHVTGGNDEDGAAQAILRMLERPVRGAREAEPVAVFGV